MGKYKIVDRKFYDDNLPKKKNNRISWEDSVNCNFSIRYNEEIYNFTIIKYDKVTKNVYFTYNEKEFHLHRSSLLKCNIGFIIGYFTKNYKYSINDIVNGYKILEYTQKIDKNGKHNKAYKVICIKDGYVTIVREQNLYRGIGCPVCANNIVVRGINDVWTTNPELAKLMADKNDAYKYCENSTALIDWKCPNCKTIIRQKAINYIKRKMNVCCPMCNDGYSYPEKIMSNILSFLNIDFKYHYRIENKTFMFKNKLYRPEYDFYFEYKNKKYIIEMDGDFHNKVHSRSKLTLAEIKQIDKEKDLLASKNNIELIRIDCRYSNYDYIFESIQNSKLNDLFDLSSIDKFEINKKACLSRMIETCNMYMTKTKNLHTISKTLSIPYNTVYEYLKRGSNINMCDYNPNYNRKYKKIFRFYRKI